MKQEIYIIKEKKWIFLLLCFWFLKCFCEMFASLIAFASIWVKNFVYFTIKIYFFYFIYLLFKTPHIRLFILHYISLKYQIFLIFLIVFLFSQKIKFKINSVNVNLYCYCRNHVYLYNFILSEVSEFWTWLAKCYTVFVI